MEECVKRECRCGDLVGRQAEGRNIECVHHKDVAVDVISTRWRCAHIGELAGVIADVASGAREEKVGAACVLIEAGGIGVEIRDAPVPVASGCGGIGIEAGEDETLSFRRESAPGELWRDVIAIGGVENGHGFAVNEIGARQGERGELGQEIVGVRRGWSCEIHITMVSDSSGWCEVGGSWARYCEGLL